MVPQGTVKPFSSIRPGISAEHPCYTWFNFSLQTDQVDLSAKFEFEIQKTPSKFKENYPLSIKVQKRNTLLMKTLSASTDGGIVDL